MHPANKSVRAASHRKLGTRPVNVCTLSVHPLILSPAIDQWIASYPLSPIAIAASAQADSDRELQSGSAEWRTQRDLSMHAPSCDHTSIGDCSHDSSLSFSPVAVTRVNTRKTSSSSSGLAVRLRDLPTHSGSASHGNDRRSTLLFLSCPEVAIRAD